MKVTTPIMNREAILKAKQQHLQMRERRSPWSAVISLASMQAYPHDIMNYVDHHVAIIGQVRRTAPIYDPVATAMDMIAEGADAIAFYTDHTIYGSDLEDMWLLSRACRDVPVLYQNYVMNAYQVAAARAANASAIWLDSSIRTVAGMRANATTAQRLRFTVFISVHTNDELETAIALSPHVICLGSPDQDNLTESVAWLQQIRGDVPRHVKLMLGHSLRTLDEVRLALEAGVRGIIVTPELLRSETAHVIREWVGKAE